jgi:RNA polymerase sigma factor (sigma-70 family)
MDYADLARRAGGGEVKAFVELTRRFQQAAFGSALALTGDFQQAEDVIQEAFVAAWSALPSLENPEAFPGWLRTIVRHHAFRLLRRKEVPTLPLAEAADTPSEEPAADHKIEQRQRAAAVLATLSTLPARLREPSMLFFVHECSHQDIATFLDLTVTTVNNRLHAARVELKRRTLTMVANSLHGHGLPDDFANRIGRLIETRGPIVEALFDPGATPDILTELSISDEANRRAVSFHVAQRRSPGIVRGVAASPTGELPRGSTVLSSGRHTRTPFDPTEFAEIVRSLSVEVPADHPVRLLNTGIKVIDVMCPLVAGGTLAIAGDVGGGSTVVMEELVRRLSVGSDRLTILLMMPPPSAETYPRALEPGWSLADELKEEGYSEGTVGMVQTLFFRAEEGWTPERLTALAPADTVIRLSLERARAKVYPTVDVLNSRSRLLETKAVEEQHVAVAVRVRKALADLWSEKTCTKSRTARLARERALKLQNYFTQPFYCAEPWTKLPGVTVGIAETLRTCQEILDGRHDDVPVEQFYFRGGIDDIRGGEGLALCGGPVRR